MEASEVQAIVRQTLHTYGISFKELKPRMTTMEVAKFLKKSDDWVRNHKMKFNPKRTNERGDYDFDTEKVINYQIHLKANEG